MDDKINVRVADFGLARDVQTSDYYRQQGTGRIPVKWMAPETLSDRISNEKTDVVSLACFSKITVIVFYLCSGHMESHVGKYLVLVVLPTLPYPIMKYQNILSREIGQQNHSFVLIACEHCIYVGYVHMLC